MVAVFATLLPLPKALFDECHDTIKENHLDLVKFVMCTLASRDFAPFFKYMKRHVYPEHQSTHDKLNQIRSFVGLLSFSTIIRFLEYPEYALGVMVYQVCSCLVLVYNIDCCKSLQVFRFI